MYHFGAAQGGVAVGVATIFEKMRGISGFLEVGGGISGREARGGSAGRIAGQGQGSGQERAERLCGGCGQLEVEQGERRWASLIGHWRHASGTRPERFQSPSISRRQSATERRAP